MIIRGCLNLSVFNFLRPTILKQEFLIPPEKELKKLKTPATGDNINPNNPLDNPLKNPMTPSVLLLLQGPVNKL